MYNNPSCVLGKTTHAETLPILVNRQSCVLWPGAQGSGDEGWGDGRVAPGTIPWNGDPGGKPWLPMAAASGGCWRCLRFRENDSKNHINRKVPQRATFGLVEK